MSILVTIFVYGAKSVCVRARDLISFQELDKSIGVSSSIETHSSFHIWALSCIHLLYNLFCLFLSRSPHHCQNGLWNYATFVCAFFSLFRIYTLAFALSISITYTFYFSHTLDFNDNK